MIDLQPAGVPPRTAQAKTSAATGQIIAYLFFFGAGTFSACLGFLLVAVFFTAGLERLHGVSLSQLSDMLFSHRHREDLLALLLAGPAAALAAWAVRRPFLRAVHARSRRRVYLWVLLGVIVSHVTFTVLFAVCDAMFGRVWSVEGWLVDSLAAGLVSVLLGFVTNMLIGIAFAEGVLQRGGKRQPDPVREHACAPH